MKYLDNITAKEAISEDIKMLVEQINAKIRQANDLSIDVKFIQNNKMGKENSDLCVFISETVSY